MRRLLTFLIRRMPSAWHWSPLTIRSARKERGSLFFFSSRCVCVLPRPRKLGLCCCYREEGSFPPTTAVRHGLKCGVEHDDDKDDDGGFLPEDGEKNIKCQDRRELVARRENDGLLCQCCFSNAAICSEGGTPAAARCVGCWKRNSTDRSSVLPS